MNRIMPVEYNYVIVNRLFKSSCIGSIDDQCSHCRVLAACRLVGYESTPSIGIFPVRFQFSGRDIPIWRDERSDRKLALAEQ